MKIFLIGMPGSGKSTLGRQLADHLAVPFVDLDKEIEQREGKSIPDIFTAYGEDYFRQVEAALLREWAALPKTFVMSTGGGTPCFFNGIDVINNAGLSIFLNTSVPVLLSRIQHGSDRPLLQESADREQKLTSLLTHRLPYYQQAKITVLNPDLPALLKALHINR
jgi:shikimate kinase